MTSSCPLDLPNPALENLVDAVDRVIRYDPGRRGLSSWAEKGDLLRAALSLLEGWKVAIATGFFIPSEGAIETDGPPGALVLAHALQTLGKTAVLVVDEHAAEIIRATIDAVARVSLPVIALPPGVSSKLRALPGQGFSHVVAVERPGCAADGVCYSMRGEALSAYTAGLDHLFLDPDRTFTTVGIGDGGNELGVCIPEEKLAALSPDGPRIECRTPADYRIYAGVSNWGAYGLCAVLSAATGRYVVPSVPEVAQILRALVKAGAVDGVSCRRSETVDGLPRSAEEEIVRRLGALVVRYGVCPDE